MSIKRLLQPIPLKNSKNILYDLPELSREELISILNTLKDGIFGIEAIRTPFDERRYLFTPPHYKFDWNRSNNDLLSDLLLNDMTETSYVQFYLSKSSLFPLEMNVNKSLWDIILDICPPHINLFYQLLLIQRQDNWRERLEEQYKDYLNGIEQPASSSLLRKVQRNMNDKVEALLKWGYKYSPIEEVEMKFSQVGYRFNLRLILIGGDKKQRTKYVRLIQEKLNEFSYLNHWSANILFVIGDMIENVKNRKLDNIGKHHVLSVPEVFPFIIYQLDDIPVKQPLLLSTQETSFEENKLIHLLPKGQGKVEVDIQTYHNKFINAFKEVTSFERDLELRRARTGATIMKLSYRLPKGLKLSDITKSSFIEDLQIHMGMKHLSIEQSTEMGEVDLIIPLEERQKVFLRDYIDTIEFRDFSGQHVLPFLVGVDSEGEPIYACLNKIKHLLVVGTTGSGKSVWINQLILTLLLHKSPKELSLYMIDVKQVEFPVYEDFPHVHSVVTDANEGIKLLLKLIDEMNNRYTLFKENGVKNIALYNKKFSDNKLPYIVCVIDEYAELSIRNKEVHDYVQSITQLSRAAGIHLIIATQRPSFDIIPSVIKSNLPSKIGFYCANTRSYLTFLNTKPPFNLLGHGDGTMSFEGQNEEHIRFQGCLIVDDPNDEGLENELLKEIASHMSISSVQSDIKEEEESDLEKLKRIIILHNETRVSKLQKILKININKLNTLMKMLVKEGFLSEPETRQSGYKLLLNEEEIKHFKEKISYTNE